MLSRKVHLLIILAITFGLHSFRFVLYSVQCDVQVESHTSHNKTHCTVQETVLCQLLVTIRSDVDIQCLRAYLTGHTKCLSYYSELKGWGEEYWTEHLVMATGEIQGKRHIFINVYAPSHGATRTLFFDTLRDIRFPAEHTLVCGGDFNCVVRAEMDRRGSGTTEDMGARSLRRFIEENALVDTGEYCMPEVVTDWEMKQYVQLHHTHRHTAADGTKGSSRIDRWYISGQDWEQVRGVTTDEGICDSDHRGVILEIQYPKRAVQIKKREVVYPPPTYVQAATKDMIAKRIQDWGSNRKHFSESAAAEAWDRFKTDMKKEMMQLKQRARRRMTRGFRQRIRRLKRKLATGGGESNEDDHKRREWSAELRNLQTQRRTIKRRGLITKGAWSLKASSKYFFSRICTKYGDNIIPTLTRAEGGPKRGLHEKADTLEDSWARIFTGTADNAGGTTEYIEKHIHTWEKVDLDGIDKRITEDEVAAAIKKCKTGKACEPDSIGNEWYRDHAELLVPILTTLFSIFMEEGKTPQSFGEAYIFSITKGGDTSNALNYRPIALLNTDYKIFTRILAWRVRVHITKLVHTTQYSFIPGRTIHEAIDLLEASKLATKSMGEYERAQVLLLDFVKAYDSLDREFLHKVLEAKGFPSKFRAIVKATHENTTVKFMANGTLSRAIAVTSGIRQGCPLAPLLFILAVDLLYDAVHQEQRLKGLRLEKDKDGEEIQVAGYADDTAIYIANSSMQRIALGVVQTFSDVSGLRLNLKKSVALQLWTPTSMNKQAGEEADPLEVVKETRCLGHITGPEDTTQSAWTKAFAALTTRLAVKKTNSVQERAAIAAAFIIPKLLYVARHAWPTKTLTQEADWRIRASYGSLPLQNQTDHHEDGFRQRSRS
uniref:Reverse transcriptase, putative n=1 Tax=Phytophthora infestans TaxID=4787 RepID=Q572J7_PHYIN|nr:reverse transcriptase precursor, putative [Phytophthora infestans]